MPVLQIATARAAEAVDSRLVFTIVVDYIIGLRVNKIEMRLSSACAVQH